MILSTALDTNGQNARFVKAAQKHGKDAKVLDVLALGQTDPAGVVARFAKAGDEYGLRIRSAHKAQPYFRFPGDILWNSRTDAMVKQLARAADVIHLNNTWRAYKYLRLSPKPALLHHHGSLLRGDPDRMLAVAKHYRMTQAVSTIDLTRYDPAVLHWLPTAYDLDELAALRASVNRRRTKGKAIRIVHCPTNRALKGTDVLIRAVRALVAKGLPVELVIVEGKTNAETLAEKAKADVVFDQLAYGYGCNAVEAWGMGVPVVAGADEWTLAEMRRQWGDLPFYVATPEDLTDRLSQMLDPAVRKEWGQRGRAHVEAYHAEGPALRRLAELYALTISERRHRVFEPTGPITFANPKNRPVFVENDDGMRERVNFPGGIATVTDPLVVDRLRRLAATRPLWGIVEVPG